MGAGSENNTSRLKSRTAPGGRKIGFAANRMCDLLRRLRRDRSGNYAMIVALATPVLIGLVGLGTEDGLWLYTHQTAQSAADAAAFSAAQNFSMNGENAGGSLGTGTGTSNLLQEADAIAASYGLDRK